MAARATFVAVCVVLTGATATLAVQQTDTKRVCTIDFDSVRLTLRSGDRFARADYLVGDDCQPDLRSVTHAASVPKDVAAARNRSARADTAAADATLTTASASSSPRSAGAGSHVCTIEVREEDVAGVAMVTLRNSTSWETAAGEITGARVHETAFANLDWWFTDGTPVTHIAYVREPYTASSSAADGYYCKGAGPLARYVCSGPSYRVTLTGEILFDGGGTCSGKGHATGSLVPGGRVRFDVTRDR